MVLRLARKKWVQQRPAVQGIERYTRESLTTIYSAIARIWWREDVNEYGSGTAARHGISGPTSSNNLDDIVLRIVKTELKHYMN
jgi:hypothetical protein